MENELLSKIIIGLFIFICIAPIIFDVLTSDEKEYSESLNINNEELKEEDD